MNLNMFLYASDFQTYNSIQIFYSEFQLKIYQFSLDISSWLSHRYFKQCFQNEILNTLPSSVNLFFSQTSPYPQLVLPSIWLVRPAVFDSSFFLITLSPGTSSISSLLFLVKMYWFFTESSQHQIRSKYYRLSSDLCSNYFAGLNIYLLSQIHIV